MFAAYVVLCSFSILILIVFSEPLQNIFDKQNDYDSLFERMELISYDKNLIKRFQVVTFKLSRTRAAVNLTIEFNVDVGNNLEVISQAYKFMSNEYRFFPIRLQVNLCFAISNNLMGLGEYSECGNFSGCPIHKARIINVCKWAPDQSKFPPLIPDGRYMMEYQVLYSTTEAAILRSYGEVFRPII